MSDVFEYDDQSSYESNFNAWYSMNSVKRGGITKKNPTLVLLLKEYLASSMEENQSKKLSAIY
jgi:hypothetical protein